MPWDIYCRVIDNHGDVGVCWRLAADLASRGEAVRLHVDDASALAWMAPGGALGVTVLDWASEDAGPALPEGLGGASPACCDVVVEAFGCELPERVRRGIFESDRPPAWIDLEYLTAEPFAERSHGLCSPQFDASGRRRDKWFFFPGFGEHGGGLIRELDLPARQVAFDKAAWLRTNALEARPGERVVSVFCYANDCIEGLVESLAGEPTLLLVAPGEPSRQVVDALGPAMARRDLRAVLLPHLTQIDYDHLLWSCDLNLVRGEDSFVRAQWAGVPFLWQIYPQSDGAHEAKLEAFLRRFLHGADAGLAASVRTAFEQWNGIGESTCREGSTQALPLPAIDAWRAHCRRWRDALAAPPDLVTRLVRFVGEKR